MWLPVLAPAGTLPDITSNTGESDWKRMDDEMEAGIM